MKKIISILLTISFLFTAMTGCGQTAEKSSEQSQEVQSSGGNGSVAKDSETQSKTDVWPKFITILGASSGGNAILSVSAIAQVVSEHVPSTVTAQVTAGSNQNVLLMEQGEGQFAWGDGYLIYTAHNGLESYENDPVELGMCQVMNYSKTIVQLAVRKGSGIKSIQDLKGKKVVVGAAGSGTEAMSKRIFGNLGLYKDGKYDFEAEYSGVSEGCDLISNGLADAILIGGSIPFTNFTEMFINEKIELIGFTEDEVKTLVDANCGYMAGTIPAGSYDGKVGEELLTVASTGGLICREDLPEELVYEFVKTVCENWSELEEYHDIFKQTSPEEIGLANEEWAPLHPGAKKYYQEKGYLK
ncbi:TAXI family TRAP transporter solute-binding subunit [Clostridium sp. AM58-1XD]|uniref:TAXI family TRAP transporter solute-binding subunit n=1 Tax=Clostridium sp. AM58-1XD TaxID=2292307 RepID=UPI000E534058|nr:TAXI family TRAP transporter solute-binding subunit [Clostridium sp. AM58-1XD]RGY98873.1 hypothetical protein DXA13_09500 [Clostridium sp. AM58-1XD]